MKELNEGIKETVTAVKETAMLMYSASPRGDNRNGHRHDLPMGHGHAGVDRTNSCGDSSVFIF